MISFYSLPSSIMKHPTHKVLNAAYLYYYATDILLGPADVPGSSSASSSSATAAAAGDVILDRKNRDRLGARLVDLSGDLMIVAKNVRSGHNALLSWANALHEGEMRKMVQASFDIDADVSGWV